MNALTDFTVGDRLVRPSLGQIVDGEEAVHVEPRSMEVLVALSRQAPELSPKQELIEAVWGDAFVSDEVLTHAIWDLRRALGDSASDPTFIQTIPKRGYRLIAPIEFPEEAQRAPAPTARRLWLPVAGLVLAAIVLAATQLYNPDAPIAEEATRLVLVAPESGSSAFSTFESELLNRLPGTQGLSVSQGDACPPVADGPGVYCLELELQSRGGSERVASRIRDAATDEILWSPSFQPLAGAGGPSAAAQEIKELVVAYFDVVSMPHYDDEDIEPWFDISRHDMRAVRDFLLGVSYVLDNRVGGRNPIDAAAERDPDFVAARIWRVPALVTERDTEQERLDAYLADLDRLYEDASSFEKPMIKWAQAHAAGEVRVEINELKKALKQVENRPVRFTLARLLQASGDLDDAWQHYQTLKASGWQFPGLCTSAAMCALQTGRFREARAALETGRGLASPDPETYELSVLFAVYDKEPETEKRYRERLRLLREQVQDYEFDSSPYAEVLADLAESDGRAVVARRLREFSY